jgi:hypothetical protein
MRTHELWLEITWLVQYPPIAYQTTLARLIEHYGRDAVAAELHKRVSSAGPNVVSIATARGWYKPAQRRHSGCPREGGAA